MKNKKIIVILVIFSIIFWSLGGTLAYWDWKSDNTLVTFSVDEAFICSADVGGNVNPENVSLAPAECTSEKNAVKKKLTVYPTVLGDLTVGLDLWLEINSIAPELSATENFKYAVTKDENSCTNNVVTTGNFVGKQAGDTVELLKQQIYHESVYTGDEYWLYIWLDAAETSLSTANKSFNFVLDGTCRDHFEGYTWLINFDANGGDVDVSSKGVDEGDTYGTLPIPTRDNSIFLEWNTSSDGTGETVTSASVVNLTDNQTLYAIWNDIVYWNITFDSNGAELSSTTVTTVGQSTYTAPSDGIYKLEVWGAQGGDGKSGGTSGGYGGYSVGVVNLAKETDLYVNVGGRGTTSSSVTDGHTSAGGYNGGGQGISSNYKYGSGGGGATHIATASGVLSSLSSNTSSILIVAGGGGAGFVHNTQSSLSTVGGSGGGYIGGGTSGGTQTAGGGNGSFGQGGMETNYGSGGGGGYYGGNRCSDSTSCGGGSGYIGNSLLTDKAMYCYNCSTSSDASTLTYSTTNVSGTPTSNYAKSGSGAARITLLNNTKRVINGTAYGTLPTPTRTGYTFLGWNTASDGTGTTITSESVINLTADQTLYAKWVANEVTIYYNVNGGTITENATYNWSTDSNGRIYGGSGAATKHVVSYGSTVNLNNVSSGSAMEVTKSGYHVSDGAEWKCISGCTISNKTFDQDSSYSATDFCNPSSDDCEVELGVNWVVNDSTKPTCTISLTAGSTTIKATYSDAVGVTGYYTGTTAPSSSTSYTAMTSSTSGSKTQTAAAETTYYFAFKDAAGNVGTCSATVTGTTTEQYCPHYGNIGNCYSSYYTATCSATWQCTAASGGTLGTMGGTCVKAPSGCTNGTILSRVYSCPNGGSASGTTCYVWENTATTYTCGSSYTKLSNRFCAKKN